MNKLLRTLMLGVVVSAGFAGVASAAEEKAAAKPASAEVKAGDTVYVCGCGASCACNTIKAEPGKCSCGKELSPVKVTKVENGKITVDKGGKEASYKAPFKCGCGSTCGCNTAAFAPGKCHCGKELVKND